MQKKFFSNLVLMLVLNLLVKPISIFGIDTGVQNRVGAEEYGLYFSLLNLSFLFNILMDLGINNFTTKNVAQFPHIVSRYMGKVLSFRILLFVIYAGITFGLGALLGHGKTSYSILCLLVFNQFLVMLIAYMRSHFAGWLYFKHDALFSVLDRLLLILICGSVFILTVRNEFQIEWFVWIQTICYILSFGLAFVLLSKKIGRPKLKLDFVFSLAIIRKSYPYALLILLMMFYTRQDSIMLESLHENGAYEAGVYAQGFRLLDAFFMFGMLFTGLLLPLFSNQMHNKESNLQLLLLSAKLLIGGAVLLAWICYLFPHTLLGAIYDNDIEASVAPFRWLMIAFIGMSIFLIFGTFLTAAGEMRFLNKTALVGIVLNLSLNILWIPTFGAEGAAVATIITQSITSLLQAYRAGRYFGLGSFKDFAGRLLIFAAFLTIAGYYWPSEEPGYLLVALLGGIALLILLKVWNISEMIQMLKQIKEPATEQTTT